MATSTLTRKATRNRKKRRERARRALSGPVSCAVVEDAVTCLI
jgi:hypothetical protein